MNAKELFVSALVQATAVVDHVEKDDYIRPTPDTDWDVRKLAGHMLSELCWVPDMLAGKTIDEVGSCYDGDLIGDALQANWRAAAERAKDAVMSAKLNGVVHTATGDVSVDEYLRQTGTDQLIHSWDLGEAIGRHVQFGNSLTVAVQEYILPHVQSWRKAGLFAPAVSVPETADAQTKLLAVTGRRVNWPAM